MSEVALDESALDASAGEETESASGESSAMPVFDLSGIDLDLDLDEMAEAQAKAEAEAVAKPEPEAEEKEVTAEVEDLFAAFEMEAASELDVAPVEELPVAEMPGAEMPGAEPPAQTEPELDPELREEVNTKLDLARAYLEMGDREGAREILQEVLGEGDTQQKAEAAQLMADAS
jgi:pilus assembly protein FimV